MQVCINYLNSFLPDKGAEGSTRVRVRDVAEREVRAEILLISLCLPVKTPFLTRTMAIIEPTYC